MEETMELAKKLISTPSTLGDTASIEGFALDWLSRVKGAEASLMPVSGIGNNVVAKVVHGPGYPTVLLNGHLDTVEVCGGWTRDPFKPAIEGDSFFGLGSADMKSGVAIAMVMFKELARAGCINTVFAGSVDEEGNSAGTFALLDSGVSGDICIIPEPSGGKVMLGCRGRVVFEANVRGTSAHGSRPGEGVNAINEAAGFVRELEHIPLVMHPQLGQGSVCVLEISGGTRTLSVPDRCWLKIDRHYVPGETKESMLGDMRAAAARLGSGAIIEISLWKKRPTPFLEPYITQNGGLVRLFTEAVGSPFSYGKSVGDYNAFAKFMPTAVYGPLGTNWHAPDEHVSVSSITECLDGYRRFVASLVNNKPFIAPRH